MNLISKSQCFLTNNNAINQEITQKYNQRFTQPDLSAYQINLMQLTSSVGTVQRILPNEHFPPYLKEMSLSQQTDEAKKEHYGDLLYKKIYFSRKFGNFSRFYSKIVGIFLESEEHTIEKLVNDDNYFNDQTEELLKRLMEHDNN
jgi:hypothetical protein